MADKQFAQGDITNPELHQYLQLPQKLNRIMKLPSAIFIITINSLKNYLEYDLIHWWGKGEPSRIHRLIARHWKVLVLFPLLTAGVVFYLTRNTKKEYVSNTRFTPVLQVDTESPPENDRVDYFAVNDAQPDGHHQIARNDWRSRHAVTCQTSPDWKACSKIYPQKFRTSQRTASRKAWSNFS